MREVIKTKKVDEIKKKALNCMNGKSKLTGTKKFQNSDSLEKTYSNLSSIVRDSQFSGFYQWNYNFMRPSFTFTSRHTFNW